MLLEFFLISLGFVRMEVCGADANLINIGNECPDEKFFNIFM